jgi:hypothetical protein
MATRTLEDWLADARMSAPTTPEKLEEMLPPREEYRWSPFTSEQDYLARRGALILAIETLRRLSVGALWKEGCEETFARVYDEQIKLERALNRLQADWERPTTLLTS